MKQSDKVQKIVSALLNWFSQNARDLPWRRTRDPYAIWVSEIMLQQTQVKTVLPFWERWMRELPTIESVANASSEKIHKLWEGLGYYHRARNLQKAAQIIVKSGKRRGASRSGGGKKSETPHVVSYKFPEKFEDVLALPGIGRYTAGAICSIAFNQPTPLLDGNVIRVLTRIFGIEKDPREKETNEMLWRLATELVCEAKRREDENENDDEDDYCSHLNQSLMELGALVCTSRNPQCAVCPAKRLCVAFKQNRVDELPNLGKRAAATARRFVAFVMERRGKFLVRQRPENVVNAHLWEFPNVEANGYPTSAADIFKAQFGFVPPELQPLPVVKHSITRYRITLEAFRVSLKKPVKAGQGTWLAQSQLDSLAFTSAHRKICTRLQK